MSSDPPSTTSASSVRLVAKDAPSSVSSIPPAANASFDQQKQRQQRSSDVFVSKRVNLSPSTTAIRPPFVRRTSDEGFSSAATGSSASKTQSTASFEASGLSLEAALRGGDFKCGLGVDSMASWEPCDLPQKRQQQQARHHRDSNKKAPFKVTLCPTPDRKSASVLSPSASSELRSPFEDDRSEAGSEKDQGHFNRSQHQRERGSFDDDCSEDRCDSVLLGDLGLARPFDSPEDVDKTRLESCDENRMDSGLWDSKVAEEDEEGKRVEKPEREVDYYQVDQDKDTPLHVAVLENEDAAVFIISKAKCPSQLNMHNESWSAPIHLAAKIGNADSLRDLIVAGANVTERDARGDTALHIACRAGHYESVLALTRPLSQEDPVITEYKPPFQRLPQNLEVTNYDGLTCFHLAAMHRRKRIMRELFRFGADVNAAEAKSGRTALHFAVEKHDAEVVKYLLQDCKADVNCEAFDGSTPLCLAEGRSFKSMALLLRSYGADRSRGIRAFRKNDSEDDDEDRCGHHDKESDYESDFDSTEDCFNMSS